MKAIPTKPGFKLVGINRHMEPVYEPLPEPEPKKVWVPWLGVEVIDTTLRDENGDPYATSK